MIHLYITVEGQTEKEFVDRVMRGYLSDRDVFPCSRLVLTSRDKKKEHRGGFRRTAAYQTVKDDILIWMKEQKRDDCRFTTMFDLYALPDDFPGMKEATGVSDPYSRIRIVEDAFSADINDHRFFPYIQLYEFETLLFSDVSFFSDVYFENGIVQELKQIVVDHNDNPELIDDGENTAPSKRIMSIIPEYDKVTAGTLIAESIGLDLMRNRCSHFSDWLNRLESL
ncbi:hypothetical protein CSA37_06015 [Candidatus Fermentibacteria bacterium]|nr:MAG: hypothetical protein CSA37_06015 [Candidatus Fermentibacteria bacterium]